MTIIPLKRQYKRLLADKGLTSAELFLENKMQGTKGAISPLDKREIVSFIYDTARILNPDRTTGYTEPDKDVIIPNIPEITIIANDNGIVIEMIVTQEMILSAKRFVSYRLEILEMIANKVKETYGDDSQQYKTILEAYLIKLIYLYDKH